MGREVRRVIPDWMPPTDERGHLQPMFNSDFATAADGWKEGLTAWERGEREDYLSEESRALEFWECEGDPPNRAYYRPAWKPEEMTWFQVYETVSEGTPVTPAFATTDELIDYLVANGDFWDQNRGHGGWSRESATAFVGTGWAPSAIIMHEPGKEPDVRFPRDTKEPPSGLEKEA